MYGRAASVLSCQSLTHRDMVHSSAPRELNLNEGCLKRESFHFFFIRFSLVETSASICRYFPVLSRQHF